MDTLSEVRHLLDESSDPENPTSEELRELLARTQRVAVIGLSRNVEKTAARADGLLAFQDLCSFRVHCALFP